MACIREILDFGFWPRKNGYADQTIERRCKLLRRLSQFCNLDDAEDAKAALVRMKWSLGSKDLACDVLATWFKFRGITWEKPRYRRVEKLPFVPLETEVDVLICGAGPKTAAVLQTLKETGARIGELWMPVEE